MGEKKKISPIASSKTVQQRSELKAEKLHRKPTIVSRLNPSSSTTTAIKQQPIRATYVPPKKPLKISEKNVMNSIHNVTVASPPSIRRELPAAIADEACVKVDESVNRQRTRTRTLEPDEILIIKDRTLYDDKGLAQQTTSIPTVEVKESVAFEINFVDDKPKKIMSSSTVGNTNTEDNNEYEDDFESYESDFESISNSGSLSSTSSSESNIVDEKSSSSSSTSLNDNSNKMPSMKTIEDAEKQLDSGAYELKPQIDRTQINSIDERETKSEEQNDSGIGYNLSLITPKQFEPSSLSSTLFNRRQTVNKRGLELMEKVTFDTMTYSIFELKPISYDNYMKIYGHMNTAQISTQTNENVNDQDVQTDAQRMQTIWTQCPPKFSTKNILTSTYRQDRNGYGIDEIDEIGNNNNLNCYEESLNRMNKLKEMRDKSSNAHPLTQPAGALIDYNRLNLFLQKSAITMSSLLPLTKNSTKSQKSWLPINDKERFFILDTEILPKISKIYSNPQNKHFFLTIHEDSNRQKICIYIWNIFTPNKPIYHLTGWGQVSAIHIHSNMNDVIVAGLVDGSLAIWHVGEIATINQFESNTFSFVPSQVILPKNVDKIAADYGRVIAIKSILNNNTNGDTTADQLNDQCQVCFVFSFSISTIKLVFLRLYHFMILAY